MTKATKIVIDYAFKELDLHKLKLGFHHDNIGSKRVAEKCGFEFEGVFKEERLVNGKYKDLVYYSLFKRDYLKNEK